MVEDYNISNLVDIQKYLSTKFALFIFWGNLVKEETLRKRDKCIQNVGPADDLRSQAFKRISMVWNCVLKNISVIKSTYA